MTLITSIFIKYGMLGLVCVYFGWSIREKDQDIKEQNATIASMVRIQAEALTRNTEVMNNLGKVIEKNTQTLEELRRNGR